MISTGFHATALSDRIDTAIRLIDGTHGSSVGATVVVREARGLAIVLLFAAYENLLYTLTRSLLETASKLGVGNRRLRPGFQVFALKDRAQAARDLSDKKFYSHALPGIIDIAYQGGRKNTISTDAFPIDGSYMKRSQIELWCKLFAINDPQLILKRCWSEIDSIVVSRNGIAHGRLTPEEVGRNYSEAEIRQLIADWRDDWTDFLAEVEQLASSRDFFRTP